MNIQKTPGGRTFLLIWTGQLVSKVGTGATRFALLIWAYQQTDSATAVALLSFFSFVPIVVISPFAGVLVDRMDRRKVMCLADTGAALTSLGLLLLLMTDQLEVAHLYVAQAMVGAVESFQGPAFTALSANLLPKEQYARASGLRSIAGGSASVATPFLAGLLLPFVGIQGVLLLDLLTFAIAVTTLLLASMPQNLDSQPDALDKGNFWRELRHGLAYIWERPGLRGMMCLYTAFTFLDALTWFSILPVLILARSGGDEVALAAVQGAIGGAIVVGGLLVSIWGGPRRKIHGFLAGNALSFFVGGVLIAIGDTQAMWVLGAWIAAMLVPIIGSSSDSIWQERTPPTLQGRVFAVQNMVRQAMTPLGIMLGGLMADSWFEPGMRADGMIHPYLAPLLGSGPGSGIAVMFLGTAILGAGVAFVGYLIPAIRCIELDTDLTALHGGSLLNSRLESLEQ